MEYDVPRTVQWTGDIPDSSCFDAEGRFMIEEPMVMAFNVIPRNTPLPVIMNYLKANGGLKGWARCQANHAGTVSTEARHQVSLVMRDEDVARLVESLKSQANGFVIYNLKKTELYSCSAMWNHVAENAPGQENKCLFLALCYDFNEVCDLLDEYIKQNHKSRNLMGLLTHLFCPCTLGASFFICDSMKKKYTLLNKRPYPRDMTLTTQSHGGIVLNM